MYGRGFKLQYPSINGIGAQALVGSNGNSMGPFTKSKGLLSFYEVSFDNKQMVAFTYCI